MPKRAREVATRHEFSRRWFLRKSIVAAGGLAVAGPFQALMARVSRAAILGDFGEIFTEKRGSNQGYGPLFPVKDGTTGLPLLMLPEGFSYVSFGWRRDPLDSGGLTPAAHDGMAAFAAEPDRVRLIRNHEVGAGAAFAPELAYDAAAGGGTTTLEFDTRLGQLVGSWASISGTARNCAGGPTPWGSWLTCEETLVDLALPHGYIFEVPSDTPANPVPLTGMGRFVHEAVAVDPATGIVYETEDQSMAGFYRFVPNAPCNLAAGGTLQMLAVEGFPRYNTRRGQVPGEPLPVVWIDIEDPSGAVFMQGYDQGGAVFGRLEGAWSGNGVIYFVSTSAGDASQGQVWQYEPEDNVLRLLFESPSAAVLNNPDNVCVSPRGGLVLCEDGSGLEYLHGLTADGEIFRFAQNNVVLNGEIHGFRGDFRDSELAGATFSPNGGWLFFNIQTPGITFAVTGPWEQGAL